MSDGGWRMGHGRWAWCEEDERGGEIVGGSDGDWEESI